MVAQVLPFISPAPRIKPPAHVGGNYQLRLVPAPITGIIKKKRCTSCQAMKNHTDFSLDKSRWDRLTPQCKECRNGTCRATRAKKPRPQPIYLRVVPDPLPPSTPPRIIYADYELLPKKRKHRLTDNHPVSLKLIANNPPVPLKNMRLFSPPLTQADKPVGNHPDQIALPNGYFQLVNERRIKAICSNPICARDHTQVAFAAAYLDETVNGKAVYVLLCEDCYDAVWEATPV